MMCETDVDSQTQGTLEFDIEDNFVLNIDAPFIPRLHILHTPGIIDHSSSKKAFVMRNCDSPILVIVRRYMRFALPTHSDPVASE